MALFLSARAKQIRLLCIATIASAFAAVAIPATMSTSVEAKTPGKTYCFVGKCHRVKTIEETRKLVGVEQTVVASHYDDCKRDRYNPCGLTSSGERFHPDRPDNTASPVYPDGTQLLVWSPINQRALVVRVNNAGPYWGNRTLDLSKAAARALGFEGKGVATLKMRVLKEPEPQEARYKKNRNYDPVPGDIGQYANLEAAQRGMAVMLAFQATTGSPFAPVTSANAFNRSDEKVQMLVAEAPQAIGRTQTVAYMNPAPVAFGGFTTAGLDHSAQSQGKDIVNQTRWDEDRIVDGPVLMSAATETASIGEADSVADVAKTAEVEVPVAKKDVVKEKAAAKLVAAVYEDTDKPAAKDKGSVSERKSSEDKSVKSKSSKKQSSERRRSRRKTASYESREYRPRVAYQAERSYGTGGISQPGRSAGQLMQDNLRPL
jgi:rare lipoprotein A (peptidoglycan hydrolase)